MNFKITRTGNKPPAPATLAKFAPPALHESYARERLFQRLNRVSDSPLIWLSAPAGYGKTTVVARYLTAQERPTIWYQCDAGDADIGSFFFHLTLARTHTRGHAGTAIPLFSPDHYAAIPTYTRNYFRAWFASLPRGMTLVLDNLQEVPAESALTDLLPVMVEQVPGGVQVIVISRFDPGPNLSRWLVSQPLALLTVEDLQLSQTETAALVANAAPYRHPDLELTDDELYRLSQGWAAGLTLMLRQSTKLNFHSGCPSTPSQSIFNYLATQVFDRLSVSLQEFMLHTACLDRIAVPVARHLTGTLATQAVLSRLVHENVFTTYRPAADTYEYHPLFRSFLLTRLGESKTPAELRAFMSRAANTLYEVGDLEASIGLFLQAEDWDAAIRAISCVAADVMAQARIKTLAAWIGTIPVRIVAQDGWLSYWQGIHQFTTSFVDARVTFERAHALFLGAGDQLGQMLSCAAILRHINYCYADYRPMLPWIERLSTLLGSTPSFPSSSIELQITAGLMMSISQATPHHADLVALIDRVIKLTSNEADTPSQAAGISALQHYFGGVGRTAQYGDLEQQTSKLLDDRELAPVSRLHILWLHAYQLHLSGESGHAYDLLREARAIAQHHGLVGEELRLRVCQLQAGDPDQSAVDTSKELAALEPMARMLPPIARGQMLYVRAMHELSVGNLGDALRLAEESLPLIGGANWTFGAALAWLGAAQIHCLVGNYDVALRYLALNRASLESLDAPVLAFNRQLVEAAVALRTGRSNPFVPTLVGAFAMGRQHGYANGFHHGCQMLRLLVPEALKLGIEVTYCRWLIGKRGWTAPAAYCPQWPWPVRIRALGPLSIEVNDSPIRMTGKVQRKPLDVLKTLLTTSHGVDAVVLMDLLWPELEGDAARNSLDLAAHRLRKLLQCKDSVLSVQGKLMLNPDRVWVDVFELGRLLNTEVKPENCSECLQVALDLYRAPLLEGDVTPRVATARDRARATFVRVVETSMDKLAEVDAWDLIKGFSQRATQVEPHEEIFHRSLNRSLRALGQNPETLLASQQSQPAMHRSTAAGRRPH